MTPWSASRSSYLNEGTGSLSRSFRVTITTLLLGKPQRRDREFIPVIWRSRPVLVVEVPTSTKGPGVYPGHLLLAVLITPRVITSTKGPGVYPGHSCCVRTCTTTAPYLNEGTGSLSRSLCMHLPAPAARLTSTKGPGVYPGHLQITAESTFPYFSTSTKGPGVYPGHDLIFYQHLSSSQGSACERSERKGAIERRTTRKRTRYPSHQAKEGASNTDETQNERPLALASNNDSPIGRDVEMRPQAHDAPRCPRIGNAHIAHQNRVFLT